MLRRIGRLYPLHLFILMMFLAMEIVKYVAWREGASMAALPFASETSPSSLVSNLLLLQSLGLHDRLTWNFPSWSISVEFYVNLLFALVMVWPARRGAPLDGIRREKTAIAAALVVLFGLLTVLAASRGRVMTYDDGFIRCVYGFFCGVLTQRLRASGLDPLRNLSPRAVAALELGLTFSAIAFILYGGQLWVFALAAPLFSLLTLAYAREQGFFARLLLTPPFHAIGEWSYSIYMVHYFLLVHVLGRLAVLAGRRGFFGLDPHSPLDGGATLGALYARSPLWTAIVLTAFIAAVLAVSSLTYRFVEKPARRWFNDLAAKKAAAQRRAPDEPSLAPHRI